MDEAFYGTLPQDTQDFTQILRGVKRNLTDAARGVSYYPYDLIGAPVDIINMALTPIGLGSQQPVLGSDYLRNIAKSLGLAQDPTGSIAETTARIGAGFINPATAARTVGQIPQQVTRGANITADKLVQMITQNPEATAARVIDETQMPFLNAVAPKAPSLLQPQKSDLGFYSQLEAATIPLQNKGTGEQYLAQISKAPGVKPEELQWTGLDEFLKNRQSVTKAEIQDYLNANRVDVQEVRLGEGLPPGYTVRQDPTTRVFEVLDENGRIAGTGLNRGEAISQFSGGSAGATKFSSYTLPGGENYREILLTLPSSRPSIKNMSRAEYNAAVEAADRAGVQDFSSTHFDQPNILAHMRVNDRVVDGKKTLFIEEIQSDWHQAGRKQGYAGKKESFEQWYNRNKLDGDPPFNKLTSQQIQIAKQNMELGMGSGVPDAPFKTSWHELALKRAIQEASEKGYDQIAFTTGKTQAERYDLSKQLDVLIPTRNLDGTYTLDAFAPGNDDVTEIASGIQESDLERYVGKDLAKKIVNEKLNPGEDMELSGVDLQVGGEGMKGFYDNILPKSLDKLGKKFDAKVGKTEMDGVDVWQMDITPKMRESVTSKGQPLFAIPVIGTGLLGSQVMQEDQY